MIACIAMDEGIIIFVLIADYHQISEDKMPFKWLPLESIEDRVFTSKR
jgi:hypothetical protein